MNKVTAKYASGKMKHELKAGKNIVFADVDTATGGEDSAPSPHELLAMSLAACTSLTMRMYGQRKSWDLADSEVTVDIEKTPGTEIFKRTIKFAAGLDEEQKKKLLDIANHCPIHKALTGKIEIQTEMV